MWLRLSFLEKGIQSAINSMKFSFSGVAVQKVPSQSAHYNINILDRYIYYLQLGWHAVAVVQYTFTHIFLIKLIITTIIKAGVFETADWTAEPVRKFWVMGKKFHCRESKCCSSIVIQCSALWTASKQLRPSYWWPLQITKRHYSSSSTVRLPTSHHNIFPDTPQFCKYRNLTICHWSKLCMQHQDTPTQYSAPQSLPDTTGNTAERRPINPSGTVSQICVFGTDPALCPEGMRRHTWMLFEQRGALGFRCADQWHWPTW
jgi:hypothetical protein